MQQLRGLVEARLRKLVSFVFQCEYLVSSGNDDPRFLITTGVLSCIVVMIYEPVSKAASMAHLQEKNAAEESIAILVAAWKKESTVWVPGRTIVTFVGGRAEINQQKLQDLEKSLARSKFDPDAFKKHSTLRPKDALAINVALDRHTGRSFLFSESVKEVEWNLRTVGARTRTGSQVNSKETGPSGLREQTLTITRPVNRTLPPCLGSRAFPSHEPQLGGRTMGRGRRTKRDLHAFDKNGMVLCNPRDKEAAHRAEMEGDRHREPGCGDLPEVSVAPVRARDRREATVRQERIHRDEGSPPLPDRLGTRLVRFKPVSYHRTLGIESEAWDNARCNCGGWYCSGRSRGGRSSLP